VPGRCQAGAREVPGRCQGGARRCQGGAREVPGRCQIGGLPKKQLDLGVGVGSWVFGSWGFVVGELGSWGVGSWGEDNSLGIGGSLPRGTT
jgi:hypothetical protein